MNPVLANPNVKINMSLDEIIHFTRGEINNHLYGKHVRDLRKKKNYPKIRNESTITDHSVPLMGTKTGVDIYVSNQSPLLSEENKRRIAQAFSNRALNSNLPQKSKEIIPAEYKVVRTPNGFERILVPAVSHIRPFNKKLIKPRKLKKNSESSSQDTSTTSLPDTPPPLVAAPIYKPSNASKIEVESSDDEVINIDNSKTKKQFDLSSDLGDEILQIKKLCVSVASSLPQMSMTTLNDRFTRLCGSFQF